MLTGLHQGLGARVQAKSFLIDLRQRRHRHTAQQGHSLAQTFLVVGNLAPHGGLGDGGYLGFATRSISHLVDALDVDEGGVHVKGDQPEVLPTQGQA